MREWICTRLTPQAGTPPILTVMMLISGLLDLGHRREMSSTYRAGRAGGEDRPVGRRMISASLSHVLESARSTSVGAFFDCRARRLTTDSPSTVGSVATRMSSRRPRPRR
jgi:hypothetical protein